MQNMDNSIYFSNADAKIVMPLHAWILHPIKSIRNELNDPPNPKHIHTRQTCTILKSIVFPYKQSTIES